MNRNPSRLTPRPVGLPGLTLLLLFLLLLQWTVAPAPAQTWNILDTHPGTVTGSALDLSRMNDAPAGKYGWATIDADGDILFEGNPNAKVRFYGANIPTFMTHPQVDALTDRLAAMGYNVARIMGHDIMESWQQGIFQTPTSTDPTLLAFNTASLEQLDYLFASLKKKGIYVQMDLFTSFQFSSIPSLNAYGQSPGFLFPFLDDAYYLWQKETEMYLSHVNQYTHVALKDDPMVIGMCPWNEALLPNLAKPNSTLSPLLLTQFNTFLTGKGRATVSAFPITTTTDYWSLPSSSTTDSLTEFYTEKTVAVYNRMKQYLQNTLQVKCLVDGLNYLHSPLTNYWRNQVTDAYDMHLYYQWDIGTVTPGSGNYVYNPTSYPMLSDTFATGKYVGSYPYLSLNQEYLKPVFLTEFHDVFPNPGRDQAALFASTIGAFQGWDDINHFCFQRPDDGLTDFRVGAFNEFSMAADPIVLMSEYQGVLAFRASQLKQAPPRFVIVRDKSACGKKGDSRWENAGMANLGYLSYMYNTVTVYVDAPTVPVAVYKISASTSQASVASGILPSANLVPITSTLTSLQAAQKCIDALSATDPVENAIKTMQQAGLNQNKLVSETGEIVFDLTNRCYTVNSPRMIAAAGTLNGAAFAFSNAQASATTTIAKGTLFAASLDGQPMASSGRLVVINTTDAKFTGSQNVALNDGPGNYSYTVPAGTVSSTTPNLLLYTTGDFQLATTLSPASFTAYRIGMNGARLGTLPIVTTGNQLSVNFDTGSGFAFELIANPIPSPALSTTATVKVIVDNDSANNGPNASVSRSGSWSTSSSLPNYYATNYHYAVSTGGGANTTRWTPTLPQEGNYQVYYRIPDGNSARATNALLTVHYADGTRATRINEQPVPGGNWILMGTYHFLPGSTGYVELSDAGTTSGTYLIADAVAFVLPASIVVDNTAATQTGTWTASTTNTGYYGTNYLYTTSGTGSAKLRWTPTITTAGRYNVYCRLPNGDATRLSAANFTVAYTGGQTQSVPVNEQPAQGGNWVLLGTYSFAAGTTGYVELNNSGTEPFVIGDAIAFIAADTP
ncbi:hypothetical protein SAMN05444156_0900 [Verrucomicrobium sp. GAS474]|uniref:golvesin C-terminal-like domain-containing protein n=1 Tax=Verrucomicrobium sp. GAS474 TaxID=1882831 RepID=UPI00087DF05A|nr:hypothetical protein [Verrucomicrobium sp. GAS474]SDT93778.1 hypothetical protein SAMN05444156_0900 [Verrucomicrobium sp. GAS474]